MCSLYLPETVDTRFVCMPPKEQAPVSLEETHGHRTRDGNMMTSSNGNFFRVTGRLCGEFTGNRWIPHTKASGAELWCFLWTAPWINDWVNNREAGDLSHRAYYDVIVMKAAVLLWQVQTFVAICWPGQQQLKVFLTASKDILLKWANLYNFLCSKPLGSTNRFFGIWIFNNTGLISLKPGTSFTNMGYGMRPRILT